MVRQVTNMRLKSCEKFWKRPNAERMLMRRSWWVVGRLEDPWRFTLRLNRTRMEAVYSSPTFLATRK